MEQNLQQESEERLDEILGKRNTQGLKISLAKLPPEETAQMLSRLGKTNQARILTAIHSEDVAHF